MKKSIGPVSPSSTRSAGSLVRRPINKALGYSSHMLLIASCSVMTLAHAQTASCSQEGARQVCTLDSDVPLTATYTQSTLSEDLFLTNNAAFSVDGASAIQVKSDGSNGIDNDGSQNGNASYGVMLTNTATINISQNGATPSSMVVGLEASTIGGNGATLTDDDGNGGNGGHGGSTTLDNSGHVTIDSGTFTKGVMGAYVQSRGGAGGNDHSNFFDDHYGGNGGDALAVAMSNTGNVSLGSSTTYLEGGTRAWGVAAESVAGNGGYSATGQIRDGTPAGMAGNASAVTLQSIGDVNVFLSGSNDAADGVVGLLARSVGGRGADTNWIYDNGADGGRAGTVTVTAGDSNFNTVSNVNVGVGQKVSGLSAGILVQSLAGDGGYQQDSHGSAGAGGSGSSVDLSLNWMNVVTSGDDVSGVIAVSRGGDGGSESVEGFDNDVIGGNGGEAGTATVRLTSGGGLDKQTSVSTSGANAYGVVAQSVGGFGGIGSEASGVGQNADTATITVDAYSNVTTGGDFAIGVLAQSIGGGGGTGEDFSNGLAIGEGSKGGNGGNGTTATINASGTVKTTGQHAYGIVAQSIGGSGGAGGIGTGIVAIGGNGGAGGAGGSVTIEALKDGAAGSDVSTSGYAAIGVIGQSIGGGGGAGGAAEGILSVGGSVSNSQNNGGSDVSVSVNSVETQGNAAIGILAQSIGGGGGSGGSADGMSAIGGSGESGGNGGTVTVDPGASITTQGNYALGVVAQSIGGGGGNGGDTMAISVDVPSSSIGGQGAGAGSANTVKVQNLNNTSNIISTFGDGSIGVLAQSIGGGGGNGGSASLDSFLAPANLVIGGSSGGGGNGGETDVTLTGTTLATAGAAAAGIVAQSIGGGGGNGGAAHSFGVAIGYQVGVAVGGTGGNGGYGGHVSVALNSVQLSTGGVGSTGANANASGSVAQSDSYGVVAQSIGGGGGNGGSAASSSITVAAPLPDGGSFAIGANVAVGGSGAKGGNGGTVDAHLSNSAVIYTGGQGSHGLIAQSIGGGGGNGGGSKAMSTDVAIPDDTVSVIVSAAVGGKGGFGGNGDAVSVEMDAGTKVVTYDDLSNGVLAQSIGGGGGNGGVGSSSSGGLAQGKALSASVGVGGSGGVGGNGGTLTVTLDGGSTIMTAGSGSRGLVMQSVGGGGGTSQGTTVDVGLPVSIGGGGGGGGGDGAAADDPPSGATKFSAKVDVSVGATGAAAGNGGAATLSANGAISTMGGDADGILVQSIGGGGGLAGSAGADGTAGPSSYPTPDDPDNPPNPEDNDLGSYALTVGVGGKGGVGGEGGNITFEYSGTTLTRGDFADGIILQSIGGGGGVGGASVAKTAKAGSTLAISVGGSGGAAGDGGDIVLTMFGNDTGGSGAVQTTGDVSYGLLAQSIGGGGGQGGIATNTFSKPNTLSESHSIAVGDGGSGGNAGNGGSITMNAPNSMLSVSTSGYDSHAVVLQSIGGGGGVGSGWSIGGNVNNQQLDLSLGGGGTKGSSAGGNVTVESWMSLQTTGEHAFGLVAQSIGGGGGIVSAGPAANIGSVTIGLPVLSKDVSSADVSVTLSSMTTADTAAPVPTLITTQGRGSHGVVLQSIASGGGIIGDTANGPFTVATLTSGAGFEDSPSSGNVSLSLDGFILTSGEGAFGIIAQSLGYSGGIGGDSTGSFAGMFPSGVAGWAGGIDLTLNGGVQVSGENAYAVFAQNTYADASTPVTISVSGTVSGGRINTNGLATGGAIWIDSPRPSTVTINESGNVNGTKGLAAITQTGSGLIDVANAGTLRGNLILAAPASAPATQGTLTNTGLFSDFDTVQGYIVNSGQVYVGVGSGDHAAHVTRDFTQDANGELFVSADFVNGRSDLLTVDGEATLDGTLEVHAVSLAPDQKVTVVKSGTLMSLPVVQGESSLFTYDSHDTDNSLVIWVDSAQINDMSESYGLGSNLGAVSQHLQDMWDRGSSNSLGTLYAALDHAAAKGRDGFANALGDLSPGVLAAPALLKQAEMVSFANSLLSCPDFDGDSARLSEHDCVWGRITGNTSRVDASHGTPGFKSDGTLYQVGVQRSVAPNWFVGVAGAYENRSIRSDDRRQHVKGDSGYLGVSLKHENGPWTFAAALAGSYGTYDNTRRIEFLGAKAESDSKVMSIAQRLRVSYTHAMQQAYIKPLVDLDVIHTRMPSFNEHGGDGLNLHVKGENRWAAVLSPGVEVGARLDSGNGYTVRPYASVGVSLSTSDKWDTQARLADVPSGTDHFKSTLETGSVFARLSGGVQILSKKGMDVGLQYDGLFSNKVRSHAGSLKATWRF